MLVKKMKKTISPTKTELVIPTYDALNDLGGTASNKEICKKVIKNLKLPASMTNEMHKNSTSQTELEYKLAWCRTYLKKYGVIENIKRGIWSIQPQYLKGLTDDPKTIIAVAKGLINIDDAKTDYEETDDEVEDDAQIPEENQPWRRRLLEVLLKMDPIAFERLAKRLLYECGFTEVNVTKKTRDGGIDGTGKLILNEIFSINIAFQCKRFKNQVSSKDVTTFRGSLPENIEKGILITTGRFTGPAIKEAEEKSKMKIDLIDGEKLIDILAKHELGVTPKTVYEVDEKFFFNI